MDPLLSQLGLMEYNKSRPVSYKFGNHTLDVLVTGLGMVATTLSLSRKLKEKQYDLVLDIGIAGGYHSHIPLGEIGIVSEEVFADFGAENNSKFLSVFELGLIDENAFPFTGGKLVNPYLDKEPLLLSLKRMKGATLNCVSGSFKDAAAIAGKFNVDVETMEGAAFFYVCLTEKLPFLEFRAISNYAGDRDHRNWEIDLSLKALADAVIEYLRKLETYGT